MLNPNSQFSLNLHSTKNSSDPNQHNAMACLKSLPGSAKYTPEILANTYDTSGTPHRRIKAFGLGPPLIFDESGSNILHMGPLKLEHHWLWRKPTGCRPHHWLSTEDPRTEFPLKCWWEATIAGEKRRSSWQWLQSSATNRLACFVGFPKRN